MPGHPVGLAASLGSVSLRVAGGVQQLLLQAPRRIPPCGLERCCQRQEFPLGKLSQPSTSGGV